MKNYRQLVKELPAKKVVFAFGRFQPPTTGHELLVNAVRKIASKQGADHVIFASRTQDKKSNPLSVDRKVYYLKRMFPNTNFIGANDNIRTFMEAAKELSKKYKNIVMVAGSDRVQEYTKLLNKYNGDVFNFDTIEVVSAGDRDPDADNASGMSGTKMREAAKKGDFASFKKGLPHTLTELDGKRLMNEIRQGMGVEAIKEQVKFETSEIREKYISGEIFNIGDIVESADEVYQIKKRGSNHLLLQDQNGNLVNKWLNDVAQTEKEFVLQQGLNEMNYTAADKIKVARIIASTLGVSDVERSSNAESLVNEGLRLAASKPLRPEYIEVLHKMLETAKEADIKYDQRLVPKKVNEEQLDELKRETLKSYIAKSMGSKSAADFTRGVKMAQGSGGEEELRKKSEKRSTGIHTAIKKLTKEDLDEAKTPAQKRDFQTMMAGGMSRDDYNKKHGLGKYAEKNGKSRVDPTGVYHNVMKTIGEEAELEEAVNVSHERYVRSHSKTASGKGQWAFTHKRSGDVDYHRDDEFHKATGSFTDAKKSAKTWAKKHGHSTVYVMEETIDEGKMGQLSADIGSHIDKHVDDYKTHGGAEHLMSKIDHTAKHISKLHGLEHKHAHKFVSDYVEKKLHESYEDAEGHKAKADAAKAKGNLGAYHAHMSAHHETLGQWHENKGRHSVADKEYAKAEQHHEDSLKHPYKEEVELTEWVVKHDGVEADHPDHAIRKLFHGKKDVINHLTKHKDSAEKRAEFLKKKGYKNVRIDEISQHTLNTAIHKRYQQALAAKHGSPEHAKALKSMGNMNKVALKRTQDKLMHMAKHDPEAYKKSAQQAADSDRKRGWSTEETDVIADLLEQIANAKLMNKPTEDLQKRLSMTRAALSGKKECDDACDTTYGSEYSNDKGAELEPASAPESKIGHSMQGAGESEAVRKMKIKYVHEDVQEIDEDSYTSEYTLKSYIDQNGERKTRKIRPHRIEFKNSKANAEPNVKDIGEDMKSTTEDDMEEYDTQDIGDRLTKTK